MSHTDAHEDNKQYYLRVWTDALHTFLGWSATEVRDWVNLQGWQDTLDNPDNLLYHKSPIYWIRYLLIPDHIQTELSGEERYMLAEKILAIFHDNVPFEFAQSTDWSGYRSEVQHLLDAVDAQADRHGH